MQICDSCKKEIQKSDQGYAIRIKHEESFIEYVGCSIACCAKIFRNLADEWNNDSNN